MSDYGDRIQISVNLNHGMNITYLIVLVHYIAVSVSSVSKRHKNTQHTKYGKDEKVTKCRLCAWTSFNASYACIVLIVHDGTVFLKTVKEMSSKTQI